MIPVRRSRFSLPVILRATLTCLPAFPLNDGDDRPACLNGAVTIPLKQFMRID